MYREGHIGVALLTYSPVGFVAVAVGARELALLGGIAVVGLAMLPDVDMQVPFVPHRGPTHTVWFGVVVAGVGAVAGLMVGLEDGLLAAVTTAVFGLLVGAVTVGAHLVADALTPMGVQPLAPLRETSYTYSVARASNPLANYLLLALGGLAAAGAFAAGSTVSTWF